MNNELVALPIVGVLESLCASAEALRNGGTFYTPAEVAAILKVSRDTIIRKFADRPGVIDMGSPENGRKRQYRTLRIPDEALQRFIVESRVA